MNPIRTLTAVLAASFAVGGTAGTIIATPTAAHAISLVSEEQELAAGRDAARQVESKYRVVTGTSQARLVEQIGRRMAAASGRPGIPWKFRVIQDPAINAFSLPGYVYINTGLLNAVGNDRAALAGVIAHEVAHTDGRHSKKQMEKGAVAGLLGSLITRGDSRKAGWFNMAGNVVMLKFSRDDEYDADRKAVRYMKRTGYDPNGMIRFFQKLQKMEGRRSNSLTWLRTHPSSGDRISRLRSEIRSG